MYLRLTPHVCIDLDPVEADAEVLDRIIRLDIEKIRYYLKELRAANEAFQDHSSVLESRICPTSMSAWDVTHVDLNRFLDWYKQLSTIFELPVDPEPAILRPCIKWALKGRYFHRFLQIVFSTKTQPLPRWVNMIIKFGRCGIASLAFVQLATEMPVLFNPLLVRAVAAPSKIRYRVSEDERPLSSVLRRILGCRAEEYIPRLARFWSTADIELYFRRSCSLDLAVHAETQLISFYDHNSGCKILFRYIGWSKRSCYLCHRFVVNNPESFLISSCHQKLYPSCTPPPAVNPGIYRRYKVIMMELSKTLEATAKRQLETRLGGPRRPIAADSTAGISLAGLIEPSVADMDGVALEPQTDHIGAQVLSTENRIEVEEAIDTHSAIHPISVIDFTSPDSMIGPNALYGGNATQTNQPLSEQHVPLTSMVIHFKRTDDSNKQDIICIGDIIDSSTHHPSG